MKMRDLLAELWELRNPLPIVEESERKKSEREGKMRETEDDEIVFFYVLRREVLTEACRKVKEE